MPETLYKLSPHRDLQCYFERPSAIAAISGASATGFTVSGTWRQQFDWAVVEWNVHNVFEHPAHRNLPDGDLSGLTLTYDETRDNCIAMDSDLFPTVDWPFLRIWTRDAGVEGFYKVRLRDHAVAIEGSYTAASAELELTGTPNTGDYVGLSFHGEHHTYQVLGIDTLSTIATAIADSINNFSAQLSATTDGAKIRLEMLDANTGANANRLGIYGFTSGTGTASWADWWKQLSGGTSPTKWRVTLDFGALVATSGLTVPASKIRKMRWTYAAELQQGAYQRSEFAAAISNWTVTGTGRAYQIAGPGSRRVEDSDSALAYSGAWTEGRGNFSGGSIRHTVEPSASVTCVYTCPLPHRLYLGTRFAFNAGAVTVLIDGLSVLNENLLIPGEDVLARLDLGSRAPGQHTVTITHSGAAGRFLYFDFLEMAIPATLLPEFPIDNDITLATDWDTDHSIALPAERTAWMLHALGYHGRHNYYVGALWFYEMIRTDHQYASATLTFTGTPVFSALTSISITTGPDTLIFDHLNLIGDTADTIAKAFELELNRGYTAVRATASGNTLTISARAMGSAGDGISVSATPSTGAFHVTASSAMLTGWNNGTWHADVNAVPRVNRACRDWSREFCRALDAYGIEVTSAFSMELQHGDDRLSTGIAQRYPSGNAVWLNTPALQTNFSPESTNYWRQVHLDMAQAMYEAGVTPYLQFGEVQWWYFPYDGSGMPFYDAYTMAAFQAAHGRPLPVIASGDADPAFYPQESVFLAQLIGTFTDNVIAYVRAAYPAAKFEVLYPNDVNAGPFNRIANYPAASWTPLNLDNLKTESFTFTFERNLDLAKTTVDYPETRGFPRHKRSFLVGLIDPFTAWYKEVNYALAKNVESVVFFALDQYCLMGYQTPLPKSLRRATYHA